MAMNLDKVISRVGNGFRIEAGEIDFATADITAGGTTVGNSVEIPTRLLKAWSVLAMTKGDDANFGDSYTCDGVITNGYLTLYRSDTATTEPNPSTQDTEAYYVIIGQ